MTPEAAISWLEAILDDTLDPHDDTDAKRIEAVEFAVEFLKERENRSP
jgi:hypothetical protein